ncbi:hypothetical protein DLJ49_16120 [Rhodovulum sp. 12E13]|uniref:hypothetical protein n=1 Tax=Rhodovulum sp. 12E13 TaxID=2203891 RepID=UPI000E1A1943|nr:hypothetical protein [Rhodovulum sp. 12E13]RDC71055.1 hypothetical protein DLJ49_16120 [Rhodovulum sp. 12E13]
MTPATLILGIDQSDACPGFGPACLERLGARWRFPGKVRLLRVGADAPGVAHLVPGAQALLVFGALGPRAAGGLQIVQGHKAQDVLDAAPPGGLAALADALETAAAGGARPGRMALVGCGPDTDGNAPVAPAVEVALTILRGWGICPMPGAARAEQLEPAAG